MATAERTVVFGSAVGMHARPAATVAKAAADSGQKVTIENSAGKKANAASVLFLLALGVNHGDSVKLTVEGERAEEVADALAELMASELDAEGQSATT